MSKLLKKEIVILNIIDFLPLKIAALKEYQSQIRIPSHGERRAALKKSFLKRFLQNEESFFVERKCLGNDQY
jgi:hypothetical protein